MSTEVVRKVFAYDGNKEFISALMTARGIHIATDLLRVMRDIRNLACSDNFRLHNFVQTTYTSYLDSIRKILATAENSAVLIEGRNLPSSELLKVVNGDKV